MEKLSSLETIYYISITDDSMLSKDSFKIDPSIKLPVQMKTDEDAGNFNPSEITVEQILAGILIVLAYDKKNENLDYYRNIITQVKPNIKKELCEAAILKTKNGDFELAEEIFLALIGIDPDDIAIRLNMALFLDQRADAFRAVDMLDEAEAYDNDALSYYQDAMNAEPALPDAFFNAGFYHMKRNNFREAKECFETYIALTCDISDEELGENGIFKKERAQEIISNISNQNIDDEHFKAAYDYISSGQEEKGLEEIRIFLQNNPKVWNAWFMLGWGLRKLGRFADAKAAFLESLKYDGENNSDTYNELSLCYVAEDDFAEAKKCLMKAFEIEPESTKIISNLGFIAMKQGNNEEARKYFTAALEIDPKDQVAATYLLQLEKE